MAGQLRSVVIDGVTIGHPCCGVHNCSTPLDSVKHHYCPDHYGENEICAVTDCREPAEDGHRTCLVAEHRNAELSYFEVGKSMFQLKHRLQMAQVKTLNQALTSQSSMAADHSEGSGLGALVLEGNELDDSTDYGEDEDEDEGDLCAGKQVHGNLKRRVRFGRRRTHNEELGVMSCGVIVGRATMFGSEAPNGVRVCLIYHCDSFTLMLAYSNSSCACFQPRHHFQVSSGMIITASL